MGRLDSRAGPRARLRLNKLEDRCTPSAVLGDPKWVHSISINDGAKTWESVTSIEIEFTGRVDMDPYSAVHVMQSQLGGLLWTEVDIPIMQMSVNDADHTIVRCLGPSATEAIIVNGDYKIVLTPKNYSAPITLGSFHGIDLGDGDGDDGEWH